METDPLGFYKRKRPEKTVETGKMNYLFLLGHGSIQEVAKNNGAENLLQRYGYLEDTLIRWGEHSSNQNSRLNDKSRLYRNYWEQLDRRNYTAEHYATNNQASQTGINLKALLTIAKGNASNGQPPTIIIRRKRAPLRLHLAIQSRYLRQVLNFQSLFAGLPRGSNGHVRLVPLALGLPRITFSNSPTRELNNDEAMNTLCSLMESARELSANYTPAQRKGCCFLLILNTN